MISRRLLRIKALTILYAFDRNKGDDLAEAEKELSGAVGKAYDLYLTLLLLLVELADIAEARIETALNKKVPTWEDLNPKRRFADNTLINTIREDELFKKLIKDRHISWAGSGEISRLLFKTVIEWPNFRSYLNNEESGFTTDRKFLYQLLTQRILESEDFLSHLEETSIYWNDDLDFALIMIEKTLRRIREDGADESPIMPLYRNDEDKQFVVELLRGALMKSSQIRKLIDNNTTNWEIERIALMDILVMQLAITEIMVFPEIPVKVTLNEYIEISKYYCTSKSSIFINGILDKVVWEMREDGLVNKSGRGLIGEEKNIDKENEDKESISE